MECFFLSAEQELLISRSKSSKNGNALRGKIPAKYLKGYMDGMFAISYNVYYNGRKRKGVDHYVIPQRENVLCNP